MGAVRAVSEIAVPARPPRLTVVVMAYNEAANLGPVVQEIRLQLDALDGPAEILVVDDGSRDGTGAFADRLAEMVIGLRVIHHQANGGLGEVYRTGFREAAGETITFFPADGQFPASILAAFFAEMTGLDLLLGHARREDSPLGRLLSAAERTAYRLLFGPLPPFQGVFMVRRQALRTIALRSEGRGWAIVMELLVRASRAGWRIKSMPTPFRPRLSGRSKVQNFGTVWANFRQMLALRHQLR